MLFFFLPQYLDWPLGKIDEACPITSITLVSGGISLSDP